MPEHVAEVRPADEAAAERFQRLRGDEMAYMYLGAGAKAAHEVFLPALYAGRFGKTEHQIDAAIRRGVRTLLDGMACNDDERFMYRLGFEAVAVPAKEAALAAVGVAAALNDAAAALNDLNAALVHVSGSAAPTTSNVLAASSAPTRRPLRPEDFGCLPGPSKPANMSWADRVRRAAEYPSRSVGPIHGSGEPPAADV